MDNKEDNLLGGFTALFDNAFPNNNNIATDEDLNIDPKDLESVDDDELDNIRKNGKGNNTTKKEDSEEAGNGEEPDSSEEKVAAVSKKNGNTKEGTDKADETEQGDGSKVTRTIDDSSDAYNSDVESGLITGFFDSLSEKIGWGDVEDDEKPKSVEDLIQYFQDVIEENSKPQFANEQLEKLNQYVMDGGELSTYLSSTSEVDLDKLDMDDENNQKIVIRKFLKEKGFSDTHINRRISRLDEGGLLEDEALDSLDALKDIVKNKREQLLEDQRNSREQAEQAQQQFYSDVVGKIKTLDNVRGIKIPEKDKSVLIDYIFRPEADGSSKWAKQYKKNIAQNIIESAYFTMRGDLLIEKAKKEGSNSAMNKFKDSLKTTGMNTKSKRTHTTGDEDPIWFSAVRQIRNI